VRLNPWISKRVAFTMPRSQPGGRAAEKVTAISVH